MMLKTFMLFCFVIPLLQASPFKVEAAKDWLNAFFPVKNQVKRLAESPTTPPPYTTAEKITFNTYDCLAASNLNRTNRHGVPSLQWDATLASESADWALYLANTSAFEHSSGNYGENLYYKGSYPVGSVASCKDAVVAWYSEIDNYDFNNPGTSSNNQTIGHFTQVVWKSSTKVGVGIAAVTRAYSEYLFTFTYVVARYTPPGNYAGEYADNVPNVISKK